MENRTLISAAVAVAVVVIIGAVFVLMPEPETNDDIVKIPAELDVVEIIPEPEPEPVIAEPVVEEPVVVAPVLPPAPKIVAKPQQLNNSDEQARKAGTDLAKSLGNWLSPNEQIRKWVVFVDTAADGDLMAKHRPWDITMGSFKTYGVEGDEKLSPRNYERYDPIIEVINNIPVKTLAYYLDTWSPMFEQAYGELGKPGSFKARLLDALDQILVAEPLEKVPSLSRPSVMYTYSDVRLEAAPDLHKLLWRMGPDNAARLQLFAQALRDEVLADTQYAQ